VYFIISYYLYGVRSLFVSSFCLVQLQVYKTETSAPWKDTILMGSLKIVFFRVYYFFAWWWLIQKWKHVTRIKNWLNVRFWMFLFLPLSLNWKGSLLLTGCMCRILRFRLKNCYSIKRKHPPEIRLKNWTLLWIFQCLYTRNAN